MGGKRDSKRKSSLSLESKLPNEEVLAVTVNSEGVSTSRSSSTDEDLDEILKPLGGFGRFQMLNLFCLGTIVILCSQSELGFVFSAAKLKHRCWISECENSSSTYDQPWLSLTTPISYLNTWDSCTRFQSNDSTCPSTALPNITEKCNQFIYESNEQVILREEWGPKCDEEEYLLTLIGSLNNAGQMVGCLYVGTLADKFGRKGVMIVYASAVALLGTIKSFSVNYYMLTVIEFFEASLASFLYNGPFVLALEIVDPTKRVLSGVILASMYSLGQILLGLVQSLVLNWRYTLRILYIPYFFTFIYIWILPESLRWLINNHKKDEVIRVVRRIAKMNGKTVTDDLIVKINSLEKEGATESNWSAMKAIWKSKIMRIRSLVCFYVWLSVTFVFFGMSMNSVSINDDKFVNFILSAVIEIPSYVAIYFLLDRLGRRLTLCIFMIITGIGCVLSAYCPEGESWAWAKLVLYLVGKFGASIAFMVTDVYTTELFPTPLRSTAMGLGLMVGKLATILAPQMPLLAEIYEPLPLLIFSMLSILGGLAVLHFPETLNLKLPDTLEEAENLAKKSKRKRRLPR